MKEDPRLGLPSASAYAIMESCPGQPAFVRGLPEEKPGQTEADLWAERGTRIHKALEIRNPAFLQDDSELDDYNASLKFEDALYEQWISDFGITTAKGPVQEMRLWLNHPVSYEPMLSAQLDVFWTAPPYALIIDRKTGWNPNLPAAVQSRQLRVQAVLLWREFDDIEQIRVCHVKPKFRAEPTDHADYLLADLEYSQQDIMYHLWAAAQPDAALLPGPHCNWCRGKAYCRPAGALAMLPAAMNPDITNAKELVDTLQPEDLKKLWSKKPEIEKILAAALERLKSLDNDTLSAMGLTKTVGRIRRKIVNPEAAYRALKGFGLSEEGCWSALELKLGATADVAIREKGFTKDWATQWVRKFLAEHIEESESDGSIEYK